MINGFEKETSPLTDNELELVPEFINGLKTKIGKEKAITNKQISEAYSERGVKLSGPRIRKIINHIRIKNLLNNICATSDGYYVASSREELEEYTSGLQSRIASIQAVLDSYHSWGLPPQSKLDL